MTEKKIIDGMERLENVVSLFMSTGDKRAFLILFWTLFAKKGMLRFVDNYFETEDVFDEIAKIERDEVFLSEKTIQEWTDRGIYTHSAMVDFDDEEELREMYSEYQENGKAYPMFRYKSPFGHQDSHIDPLFALEILMSLNELYMDHWFETNSHRAYLYILSKLADSFGGEYTEMIQPQEVTNLVLALLDAHEGSIYNPFAGVCSYAIGLGHDMRYDGQEHNPAKKLIAKLNLMMNDCACADCVNEDPIGLWRGPQGFDYIVATPPFNEPLHQENCEYGKCEYVHEFYLQHSAFEAGRKSAGVYPISVCTSPGIRNLLQADLIETVILLPKKVFSFSSEPTVIIVCNKDKKLKGSVKFVDASTITVESKSRQSVIDEKSILAKMDVDSVHVIEVSNDTVLHNDCVIYPPYYLFELDSDNTGETFKKVYLSDILEPVKNFGRVSGGERKFVFPHHGLNGVSIDVYAEDLEVSDETTNSNSHVVSHVVSEDCIVVSRHMNYPAAYLHTNGYRVAISPDFDVFTIKPDIVLPLYLIQEMKKEYFLNQIKRRGDISCFFTAKMIDFLNMFIRVPESFEGQLSLAVNSCQKEIKENHKELKKEYDEKLGTFMRKQRQRKHAVLNVLGNVMPAMQTISILFDNLKIVDRDSLVSTRDERTVGSFISDAIDSLDRACKMVENFTANEEFGQSEKIELISFLRDYCGSHQSSVTRFIDTKGVSESVYVTISKADFTTALENLVSNAINHGFKEPARIAGFLPAVGNFANKSYNQIIIDYAALDYEVRISVELTGEKAIIHVMNNGELVSNSISLEHLFDEYISGKNEVGTGIGCNHTREIVEHFGGTVDYYENPNEPDGFCCDFIIELPRR